MRKALLGVFVALAAVLAVARLGAVLTVVPFASAHQT